MNTISSGVSPIQNANNYTYNGRVVRYTNTAAAGRDVFSSGSLPLGEAYTNYTVRGAYTLKSGIVPHEVKYGRVKDPDGAREALKQLEAEISEMDFTGMEQQEVFSTLYNKYASVFGEGFYADNNYIIFQDMTEAERDSLDCCGEIAGSFHNFLGKQYFEITIAEKSELFAAHLGMGDMSVGERMEAIAEMYKRSGHSYADKRNMIGMLFNTNCIDVHTAGALSVSLLDSFFTSNEGLSPAELKELHFRQYAGKTAAGDQAMQDWLDKLFEWLDMAKNGTIYKDGVFPITEGSFYNSPEAKNREITHMQQAYDTLKTIAGLLAQ